MARNPTLDQLGWSECFARSFETLNDQDVVPARVGVEHNHLYRVLAPQGEVLAEVAGRLRHRATDPAALPAVGDWVAVQMAETDDSHATIRAVLPRRSCFSRKAPGAGGRLRHGATTRQVVAANVDVVLLVTGLDDNFSPERIERYLVAASDSGTRPVVVLNKADLRDDVAACVDAVRTVALDVPIHLTSCERRTGLDELADYLQPGHTVALLGSSGVGKSTIINHLLGQTRQHTQAVRSADGRGRHTTVHRELIVAPDGGIIIDTPGMRELQIWDDDRALEEAFGDIEKLGAECHFRDCTHRAEPRCEVRRAVKAKRLPAMRLGHYHRLMDERAALDVRRDELARLENKRQTRVVHRAMRRTYKPR